MGNLDRTLAAGAALPLVFAGCAGAERPSKQVLTLAVAKSIVAAAEKQAFRRGATLAIAAVDDGGYLVVLHRLGDARVGSVGTAAIKVAIQGGTQ